MKSIKKTPIEELPLIKRHEEEALAQRRARELGIRYLNLDNVPLNISHLILLKEKEARDARVAVVNRSGSVIILAVLHPDSPEVQAIVKNFEDDLYKVTKAAVSFSSLAHAWEKYKLYKPIGGELRQIYVIDEDRVTELTKALKTKPDVERELKIVKEKDTSAFLDILFIGAIQANSSDIHVEPEEKGAKVRLRIDGVLQDITIITSRLYRLALNRIKILAELKLNVSKVGQDGRFTIRRKEGERNNDIDVRLSLIPSYFGQSIVMRLLGVAVSLLDIKELGMDKRQEEKLVANLSLPNGMILTTGPTGSGKTTLLYAALNYVKQPEIKIITIEDPVEYKIEGITQTQVNNDKGYTFEKGLQSILRQDPDVLLVGEIRSEETADTAINAALTGHLVFSTLHTNDAAGAIERFLNLKVRVNLIPAAVRLILAQRLVRKLCVSCKKQVPLPEGVKDSIKQVISLISPRSRIEIPQVPEKMYIAAGCEKCFSTGYAGRTGIFELLELNDYIEQKILSGVTTFELRKAAIENGMLTLLQHGILKLLQGITTLEEIQRIAGDAQYIEELYGQAVLSILSKTLVVPEKILERIRALGAINPQGITAFFQALTEDELTQSMIALGTHIDASDIHLEPKEKDFEIKYRVDGVLQRMAALRSELFPSFIEGVRELAGIKIGVHKRIQEGRFSAMVGDKEFHIDVRVSSIPGGYGENMVMRILKQEFTFSLEKLGIPEKNHHH
ncbi:MAG: Flp pilus assembly complex ATPase component TadA [Candidatus Colwellbacteria bacterium]|nr:Flp pilus assembly complex ATPase component TadA [Candidatus Colwellbacteria bacterium]